MQTSNSNLKNQMDNIINKIYNCPNEINMKLNLINNKEYPMYEGISAYTEKVIKPFEKFNKQIQSYNKEDNYDNGL